MGRDELADVAVHLVLRLHHFFGGLASHQVGVLLATLRHHRSMNVICGYTFGDKATTESWEENYLE